MSFRRHLPAAGGPNDRSKGGSPWAASPPPHDRFRREDDWWQVLCGGAWQPVVESGGYPWCAGCGDDLGSTP